MLLNNNNENVNPSIKYTVQQIYYVSPGDLKQDAFFEGVNDFEDNHEKREYVGQVYRTAKFIVYVRTILNRTYFFEGLNDFE